MDPKATAGRQADLGENGRSRDRPQESRMLARARTSVNNVVAAGAWGGVLGEPVALRGIVRVSSEQIAAINPELCCG
jgi:hypothetical protein